MICEFRCGRLCIDFDNCTIPCILLELHNCICAGCVHDMLSPSCDARCHGITRGGRRCSITARSTMKDAAGRLVGRPLSLGAPCCLYHAVLFTTYPAELCDAVVVYLDLETDSLDALS